MLHPQATQPDYLESVATQVFEQLRDRERPTVSVVTHFLPDRPQFLRLLRSHLDVTALYPIPYSINAEVHQELSSEFRVIDLSLSQLESGTPLAEHVAGQTRPHIHLEIGGYLAPHLAGLKASGAPLVGVVEGTRAGHRRHVLEGSPHIPVVCISLSPLKKAESVLVGPSCVFTLERILRGADAIGRLRSVLVLGYGPVGRSVAQAARTSGFEVMVFDTDPCKRIAAVADGYRAPGRRDALSKAEIVLAATGQQSWTDEDAHLMIEGAVLASCSSRDVEFRFDQLRVGTAAHASPFPDASLLQIRGKHLNFVHSGRPLNFLDGASIGPILSIVQAEMFSACASIAAGEYQPGLQGPAENQTTFIAEEWLTHWLDPISGSYRR